MAYKRKTRRVKKRRTIRRKTKKRRRRTTRRRKVGSKSRKRRRRTTRRRKASSKSRKRRRRTTKRIKANKSVSKSKKKRRRRKTNSKSKKRRYRRKRTRTRKGQRGGFMNYSQKSENYSISPITGGPKGKIYFFHMIGCPHCVEVMPIWKELKEEYGDKIKIVEKAQVSDSLKNKIKMKGYPTFSYIEGELDFSKNQNGEKVEYFENYDGVRNKRAFKNWIDNAPTKKFT